MIGDQVKAMFYMTKSTQHYSGDPNNVAVAVEFSAAFGSYLKGLPGGDEANKDWSKYTPNGKIEMTITNPAAIEMLDLGGVYEVTLKRVR